jgi:hypothetical protein
MCPPPARRSVSTTSTWAIEYRNKRLGCAGPSTVVALGQLRVERDNVPNDTYGAFFPDGEGDP